MLSNHIELLLVMAVYLIFIVMWGIYQGKHVKSSSDFSIGGRKLPGWVAALSERATGESSWALLGLPGAAYAMGVSEIWTAIGCVAGIITAWALIAWRMEEEAHKYDAQTFTDYLAKKHSEVGKTLRVVSSLVIVFFFFFYVGAQFIGGGKTLHTMFNIKPQWGMLVTALIIIPYTIFGGFRSVVYTDVVQALIMITALIVGPLVGVVYIAHHPDLFAHSIGQALAKAGPKYTSLLGVANGFQLGFVISGLSWFFGYLGGMPQLTSRFMAIRDRKQAKIARNVGIAWTVIAYIGALSLGWIGLAIFGPHALSDREYVMPMVMLKIFNPIIAGILITGAIAAMISTADSLLILSSTELSENILAVNEKDTRKKLTVSRITTGVLALIALGVAFWASHSKIISHFVFDLVGYVWAGIGGPFSVVILFSLFWKKFSGKAAIVTIITGLVFTIFWITSGLENKIITARLMTFVVSLIVAVIFTLIWPKSEEMSVKTA